MDADFQELVKKGKKTQQEVDSMIQLANEVQYAVLTKKLVPGESQNPHIVFLSSHDPTLPSHALLLQPNCLPAPWRRTCANLS